MSCTEIHFNKTDKSILPIELKNIDVPSFQILKHNLIKYQDSIYAISLQTSLKTPLIKLDTIDAATFEFYKDNEFYARDKHNIYYIHTNNGKADHVTTLTEVDSETFAITPDTSGNYAVDKHNVYQLRKYNSLYEAILRKLEGVDPQTFQAIDNSYLYLKDRNSIYLRNFRMSDEDPLLIRLEEPDASTFEVFDNNEPFARDKDNLYYIQSPQGNTKHITKLPQVDMPSFEVIERYPFKIKDKNGIYNRNALLKPIHNQLNIKSISYNNKTIRGSEFNILGKGHIKTYIGYNNKVLSSKDNNYELLEDADPLSFTMIGIQEDTTFDIPYHSAPDSYTYWKDSKNIYVEDKYTIKQLKVADPQTFELLAYPYAKDKNFVYKHGAVTFTLHDSIQIDPITFMAIEAFSKEDIMFLPISVYQPIDIYYKNRDEIYYNDKKIEDADYKTFEILDYPYAKDQYNVYYLGKVIPNLSSAGFTIDDQYLAIAHNKTNVIHKNHILEDISVAELQVVPPPNYLGMALVKDNHTTFFIDNSPQLIQIHLDAPSTTLDRLGENSDYTKRYIIKDKGNILALNIPYKGLASYVLWNIDTNSFQILTKELVKDKNSVYLITNESQLIKLQTLDAQTFSVVMHPYIRATPLFAIDKNRIYLIDDLIKEAQSKKTALSSEKMQLNQSAQSLISIFDFETLKKANTKSIHAPKQEKTTSVKKLTRNLDPDIDIPSICRQYLDNPPELLQCFQNFFYPDLWAKAPTLNPEKFKIFGKTKNHWYIGDDQYVLSFGENDDYWHKHGNLYDRTPYRNYYQLFHHKDIADPATFEIIIDDLAKDKHQTYSIRYVAKKTPTPVFTHQY